MLDCLSSLRGARWRILNSGEFSYDVDLSGVLNIVLPASGVNK